MVLDTSALLLTDATHEQCKQAVTEWHYSRRLPSCFLGRFAVYEQGEFIGVVIFTGGIGPRWTGRYGIPQAEGCELARVALKPGHKTAVSRIVRIALVMLRARRPNLRLVVSFADIREGHHGGIYQAGGWVYTGVSDPGLSEYFHDGQWRNQRSVTSKGFKARFGSRNDLPRRPASPKHRYLYPLDKAMKEQIAPLMLPYPDKQTDL